MGEEEYAPTFGYTSKGHPDGLIAETQLLKYIWDNYVQLTEAQNVILIGHGSGCQALMCLINERPVEDLVKMVIQIAGMNTLVKPDTRQDDKIVWFREHSKLYVPQNHPVMDEKGIAKRLRTQIITFPNAKPTDIMNAAWSDFTKAISVALGEPQPKEPFNNVLSDESGGIIGTIAAAQQMTSAAVTGVASAVASVVQSVIPGSNGKQK
ncbi:hypothetical protein QFC19_001955 [Naganishia cerealis]|uniref:Uncharacterized protein n=1 Tax=Naganishia cerealis TaxID=610337 RepID=A0ACC2WF01_9TREE|nr:hypothetical protein QFC19_001955 [Naganishia cerealis]